MTLRGKYFKPRGVVIVFAAVVIAAGLSAASCSRSTGTAAGGTRTLVLGFDGMDPALLARYMEEGVMPNFKRLAETGDFKELATSMPPQSPVAWSNFITGMNPGGHGIFDFIARDPDTYQPYLSTSKTIAAERVVRLGDWLIPFSRGQTLLLRKGRAFWEILEDNGIPATVIKVPANFPPVKSTARTISGMGTPDILGTYGTFTFYTTREVEEDDFTSGRLVRLAAASGTIKTGITGPPNPLKASARALTVPMEIIADGENPVALVRVGDQEALLAEGEWSDWMDVSFKLAPTQSISGIFRVYLMEAGADLSLYMTPVNIDPASPSVPISSPPGFSSEMASSIGDYYTLGMPEDTKALDQGSLDNDSFLAQADIFLSETTRMLDRELGRFEGGLLFVYFSTTDPVSHMFWRNIDPGHPGRSPEEARKYSGVIRDAYIKMDRVLGDALERIDDSTTVLVVSDHGFGSFRRYFNLNTWLLENGYLALIDPSKGESGEFFENVDFNRTLAYALGFNGLYLNMYGREGKGFIQEGRDREKLTGELIRKLESVVDPKTGERVIRKVYRREELYSGKHLKEAPDLLIGYNAGYRASWETALGKVPAGVMGDNMKRWSGSHLRDYTLVPGIVLSNRKITAERPALYDIAPTILAVFGIEKDPDMTGESIY